MRQCCSGQILRLSRSQWEIRRSLTSRKTTRRAYPNRYSEFWAAWDIWKSLPIAVRRPRSWASAKAAKSPFSSKALLRLGPGHKREHTEHQPVHCCCVNFVDAQLAKV